MFDFFKITPKKRKVLIKSKKGVIYSNPPLPKKIVFYIGNVLLVLAGIFLIYLYWPIIFVSGRYYLASRGVGQPGSTPTVVPSPSPGVGKTSPPDTEYSITIPKIMAKSMVIPDVPPFDKAEYLKILENDVVAQAKDTDRPGEGLGKMTYIFAHSTQQGIDMVRKNAVFYLLGELVNDDTFSIRYMGNTYIYSIYDKKVVAASEIEYLEYKEEDKEVAILQTCWPIGTDWKRLLVFAKRIK